MWNILICDQVSGRYLSFYGYPEAIASSSKALGFSSGTPVLPVVGIAGGEASRCLCLGRDPRGWDCRPPCLCSGLAFSCGLVFFRCGCRELPRVHSTLPGSLVIALEVGVPGLSLSGSFSGPLWVGGTVLQRELNCGERREGDTALPAWGIRPRRGLVLQFFSCLCDLFVYS